MNRLKELRLLHGYKTQKDLADVLFVNQTAVSQWERGATVPSSQMLSRLSELYGVTINYLLGTDLKDTDHAETEAPAAGGVVIPVLGDVAAGIPIDAIENIVDYEEIDQAMAATGEFFGLRVKGSSMEPRIREGDVVIVRKQEDVNTGDTAVVLVNGDSATVKRIKKEPGGISLIPNNPAYDVKFYSNAEIITTPVTIIGRVVELRGKF